MVDELLASLVLDSKVSWHRGQGLDSGLLKGDMLRYSVLTRTVQMLLLAALTMVSVSTEPIRNGFARVVLETGQVSVMRGVPQALFVGDSVKHQDLIVTGRDGYARFEVADGSTFEVFPNSQVVFHNNPTPTYKDLLDVVFGRIKVFIQHLNGPNYNSVTTPTAVISVRGTVFVVEVEDDEGTTVVAVDDGLVQVRNLTAPGAEPLLKPGEAIRVYRGQPLLAKLVDHQGVIRAVMRIAEDTIRVMAQRGGGMPGGVGLPGGASGPQGDRGKNGTGSGTGSSTGTGTGSSAPPAGPSAPPAGPSSSGGH